MNRGDCQFSECSAFRRLILDTVFDPVNFPAMDFQARQTNLRQHLPASRLDSLLLNHLPNIRYLCGFTGSSGYLLVRESGSVFFSDFRYDMQARDEVKGAKIVIVRKNVLQAVGEWIAKNLRTTRNYKLGIEADHMTVGEKKRLDESVPQSIRLKNAPPLVEQARMVKDADELQLIRAAVNLGASLFQEAIPTIKPGIPETQVAAEMEYNGRRAGADGMSFPTIIASGARSALPHGRASDQPIAGNGFVVCDFGVILAGYCSDQTRTVWVGKPTAEVRSAYQAVREAQQAGIEAIRPGVSVGKVDAAARSVLRKAGLARYFTHSTGHGVGLEIHEAPRVAAGQEELLQPGMVISIEPGIYFPGKWGVRIEDMVAVTESGCEVLTPTSKNFMAVSSS